VKTSEEAAITAKDIYIIATDNSTKDTTPSKISDYGSGSTASKPSAYPSVKASYEAPKA